VKARVLPPFFPFSFASSLTKAPSSAEGASPTMVRHERANGGSMENHLRERFENGLDRLGG
jgi:hypothetical protein